MIQILKKLFGGSAPAATDAGTPAAAAPPRAATVKAVVDANGVEQFVDFVVRSLVDHPESVHVTTEQNDRAMLIKVTCEKKDIGKIIGRQGKTISAIRALANGAGGRLGQRINVEVLD